MIIIQRTLALFILYLLACTGALIVAMVYHTSELKTNEKVIPQILLAIQYLFKTMPLFPFGQNSIFRTASITTLYSIPKPLTSGRSSQTISNKDSIILFITKNGDEMPNRVSWQALSCKEDPPCYSIIPLGTEKILPPKVLKNTLRVSSTMPLHQEVTIGECKIIPFLNT